MIISYSKKFVFVHVPKTGGTSMVQLLLPYLDLSQDLILGGCEKFEDGEDERRIKKGQLHKHSTAVEIKEYMGEEEWNKFFVFAFTRNPFTRAVSQYEWWKQTPWKGKDNIKEEIKKMSFEEFLDGGEEVLGKPMVHFLTSKKEKEFYSEYSYSVEVDYVGKLEDVWNCTSYVCGRLGLPQLEPIHVNTTEKKGAISTYYDPKPLNQSHDKVKRAFKEDFRIFNYRDDA